MAKRYYNLEKETKEYLKLANTFTWLYNLNTSYVNNFFISRKSLNQPIKEIISPNIVSNLQLWLDASDYGSMVMNSNGNVNVWFDKSGNNKNASNTNFANSPLLINGAKNNRSVLRFNGTTSRLDISQQVPMGDSFAVFKRSSSIQSIFTRGDNSNLRGFVGSVYPSFTTHITYRINNGLPANAAPTSASGVNYFIVHGTGNQYSSGTIIIGFDTPGYAPLNGDLCEILIYNKVLTQSERLYILNYLNYKWAIY